MIYIKLAALWFVTGLPAIVQAEETLNGSLCIVTTTGCVTVLEKGRSLPASFSYTFTNDFDDQGEVRIELKKRDSKEVEVPIGQFDLPISKAPKGKARLQVLLMVDTDRKITINTKDLNNGAENQLSAGQM